MTATKIQCRDDGRCQYAIDHGAEGLGACPAGECCQQRAVELKPCPFCGGPVRLEKAHEQRHPAYGARQFWGVVCRNTINLGSTCCMEQVPSASEGAAVARWNMRGGQP